MPLILGITVGFFLVCNANLIVTNATSATTQDHSETTNTENSLLSTPSHSAETTMSPALDVTNATFSNTSNSTLDAIEMSQFSTSTALVTTKSTVTASGSSTLKATSTLTSNSTSTAPLTRPSARYNNQTYNATSGITHFSSTQFPTQTKPTPQSNGTETTPNGTASTVLSDTEKYSMKYSEIILTCIFSTILVVVALVILFFGFKRCLRGRSQYYHHPLHETSYESADRFSPPDDTLVISGGLYDAPRIYNPNMTVLEEEESQNDYASLNSRQGQFRLEFLPGDKDVDPVFNGSQRRNV